MVFRDTYEKGNEAVLEQFTRLFKEFLEKERLYDMKPFGLVLFPVIESAHYYLMCFNLKIQNIPKVILIDNSAFDDYDAKYLGRAEHLKNAFVIYLESISHKETKNVKMSNIVRYKMPWRLSHNHVDCGVFLMRHMETFQGNDEKEYDAGFALEEDKLQKR
ncbi:hypothetical protein R6Q57_001450 [Mikania cordata]